MGSADGLMLHRMPSQAAEQQHCGSSPSHVFIDLKHRPVSEQPAAVEADFNRQLQGERLMLSLG